MPYVKLALKRDQSIPAGQPAPLHLDCRCGTRLPMPEDDPTAIVECPSCGAAYDTDGWKVTP
jgi:hypothetical protein